MRREVETSRIDATPDARERSSSVETLVTTMILVTDIKGSAVPGARVLVTDRELFGAMSGGDMLEQLAEAVVVLDTTTSETGEASFASEAGKKLYVKVVPQSGLPVAGPRVVIMERGVDKRLSYVAGDVYVGAVQLADGKEAVYVDWSVDAMTRRWGRTLRPIRQQLLSGYGLREVELLVACPRDELPGDTCKIAVCHPEIGWFRAEAALVPASEFRAPTVVAVPSSGENKPVRVMVRCLGPDGAEVQTKVRLMGGTYRPGSQKGWPRFGLSFDSGTAQLFPPGRLDVSYVDGSLVAVGSKKVDVSEDTTITLNMPFTPRRLRVNLLMDGRIYRGRAAVKVAIPDLGRSFTVRTLGTPEGVLFVSVPCENRAVLNFGARDLEGNERYATMTLEPSPESSPLERSVVLR